MAHNSKTQKLTLSEQMSSADLRKGSSSIPITTANRQSIPAPESSPPPSPRKTRNTPKRTHQVMTRFSQKEYNLFLRRLDRSGLPQGEYLRQMALTGQVKVVDQSELLIAVLDTLSDIRADLRRQNGMLKMIIRPNEGQRQLAPDEWHTLIHFLHQNEVAIHTINEVKEYLNGNC